MKRALVTGAAGFIGHHLCRYLKERGYYVMGVDWKEPLWGEGFCDDWDWALDLRRGDAFVYGWFEDAHEVYALAADMGGAGFVFTGENDWTILSNNMRINLTTSGFTQSRTLFTISACVYPEFLQEEDNFKDLAEETGNVYGCGHHRHTASISLPLRTTIVRTWGYFHQIASAILGSDYVIPGESPWFKASSDDTGLGDTRPVQFRPRAAAGSSILRP